MLVMASRGESLPQSGTVKHTLHKCASNLQYNTINVIIRFVSTVFVNNGNGSQQSYVQGTVVSGCTTGSGSEN